MKSPWSWGISLISHIDTGQKHGLCPQCRLRVDFLDNAEPLVSNGSYQTQVTPKPGSRYLAQHQTHRKANKSDGYELALIHCFRLVF